MADQKLDQILNSTEKSSNFWNDVSKLFSFRSHTEIKYCTIYKDPHNIYKYFCYKNEICCNTGNGCCSPNSSYRYLESWAFWSCVFFRLCIVLLIGSIYLICWYCKKLENNRQSRALRLAQPRRQINSASNALPHQGNPCRVTSINGSAQSRDRVGTHRRQSVDRLLETLIMDYRSRLIPDEPAAPSRGKATNREPPPKYSDALNMPRPHSPRGMPSDRSQDRSQNRFQNSSNVDEGRNFVVIEISNSDQRVPSYEEAVRCSHNV